MKKIILCSIICMLLLLACCNKDTSASPNAENIQGTTISLEEAKKENESSADSRIAIGEESENLKYFIFSNNAKVMLGYNSEEEIKYVEAFNDNGFNVLENILESGNESAFDSLENFITAFLSASIDCGVATDEGMIINIVRVKGNDDYKLIMTALKESMKNVNMEENNFIITD